MRYGYQVAEDTFRFGASLKVRRTVYAYVSDNNALLPRENGQENGVWELRKDQGEPVR